MKTYKVDIVIDVKKLLTKTVEADSDVAATIKALTLSLSGERTITNKLTANTK
ncbi:MAG: hypothetical protein LBM72_02980 [Mycoplasmataceae bacterium]|jgi:hypothetical protein|nr:hypothetical protein [Mycoplasmataceae bacterium]